MLRVSKEEAEAREAVMTFVLGLVAEPVPAKFVHQPTGDKLAEVMGRKVLEKFNCAGCHNLEPETYQFSTADVKFAKKEDGKPDARPMNREIPLFITVPTTAGTGSEVGRSTVISDDDSKVKKIIFSPKLLAKWVFADPELTLDLPPAITAATGMDALTHNVESYLSPEYHPLCDGIALEGVRIAARALPIAYRDGRSLQARSDMLMSSMMGAIAFQKDLGAVHSCAHALSTVADLHHGLANALMIDTVLDWNHEAVPAKFDELAHVCGVGGGGAAFVPWLRALKQDIGIVGGLGQRGVTAGNVRRLVEVAAADICHQTNPRPCTPADFERFFLSAM